MKKPEVICHIMGSVDGRVLVHRWSEPFGGTPKMELLKVYSEIGKTLDTDAWTFGKNTITEIFPDKFQPLSNYSVQKETSVYVAERKSERLFISIDPDADIKYPTSQLRGDDIVAVVNCNVSTEYLMYLRKVGVSYAIVNDIADLANVLETVGREFGVSRLSLQGGGILNGAMLAAGLVDELSLVVYPGIDGLHDSTSIFDYNGRKTDTPAVGQQLELLSAEKKEHGVVWIRYKLHR